ncbi:MAG: DUF726 domain-containing protein [Candidatus Sericytochromatia bacterium]|nr:DUF726 domain-containing protein [Candidatus Tanganyikabacteria bacterium]
MIEPKLHKVAPVRRAREAAVLVLGYLSEDWSHNPTRWVEAVRAGGFRGSIYSLWWDASRILDVIPTLITGLAGPPDLLGKAINIKADWDRAQANAEQVGREHFWDCLADLPEKRVDLIGYSLGARVLFYALTEGRRPVTAPTCENLLLVGGAVRRNKSWDAARRAITGRAVNAYSRDDLILTTLFKVARLNTASPCGSKPIEFGKVNNVDLTGQVKHHFDYERVLPDVARKHLNWGRSLLRFWN